MPQRGQNVVTVPSPLYERVRHRVEKGEEKNISSTFIKAVEIYLAGTDPLSEEIRWLRDNIDEIRRMFKQFKEKRKI